MPDQVIICAHRGASSTRPENTIAAFTEAAALAVAKCSNSTSGPPLTAIC